MDRSPTNDAATGVQALQPAVPRPASAVEIVDHHERIDVAGHPFFAWLRQKPVDLPSLWILVANLHAGISRDFVIWLAQTIARVEDRRIASLLAKQLNDELGNAQFDQIHSHLLRRFLDGLDPWRPAGSEAALLLPGRCLGQRATELFSRADPYEAVGALMVGEIFAKKMDHCLGEEIRRQDAIAAEVLTWLHIHEALEVEHADDSHALAQLIPDSDIALSATWSGARTQWSQLWDFLDGVHWAASAGKSRQRRAGRVMKALVFDRIGLPGDVLELRELPAPEVRPGEVRVRMVSASINPGDSLFIQNLYPEPRKPVLPQQIAGNHGAGIVMGAGEGVSPEPGSLVAFSYYNTWAEYAAVPAEWLIPLPSGYPPEKAGQLLNPITAWDLLEDSQVQPGQWVAVTAANSSVATMVVQFAQHRGVNVIPLKRQSPGDSSLRTRIMDLSGGQGLHGVIDCVGGRLLQELMECLVPGGQVIIYGGMSAEHMTLHNFDVLLKIVTIKPYIYRFFARPPRPDDQDSLRHIIDIFGREDFRVPMGGAYSLEDFATALQPGKGKNYFVFPP